MSVRHIASLLLLAALGCGTAHAQKLTLGAPGYLLFTNPYLEAGERLVPELSRRSGIAMELKALPPLRSIVMANDGDLDGDIGRIADAAGQFPNLQIVPTPGGKIVLAIYGTNPALPAMSRAEIKGLRVGALRGVLAIAKHSAGMAVTETNNFDSAFDMLQSGRVDVLMLDQFSADDHLNKNRTLTGIRRWPHAWAVEPLYLLLHKKHAALIPRLDAALVQLKREGELDRYLDDVLRRYRIDPLPDDAP